MNLRILIYVLLTSNGLRVLRLRITERSHTKVLEGEFKSILYFDLLDLGGLRRGPFVNGNMKGGHIQNFINIGLPKVKL